MVSRRHADDDPDRFGLDETESLTGKVIGALVPEALARRGIAAAVSTDRECYAPGDEVVIDIEFQNRFPFPLAVTTPTQRRWGWTVDGLEAASDERPYVRDREATITFKGRERKRIRRRWDGRFKRTDGDVERWEQATPGEYEITAYVALGGRSRPTDSTTVVFER